jgi:hypothetical protein
MRHSTGWGSFDLHDHLGRGEHGGRVRRDSCAGGDVLLVVEADGDAAVGLDKELMAGVNKHRRGSGRHVTRGS